MTRSSNVIANIVEQMWFTKYPWPQKVILNRGTEFMKDFITLVQDDYGIKAHQTIGYLLHIFEPDSADLDPEDLWRGILSAVMFALQSMMHTTHKATPIQLVFGRDTMLSIMHLANWQFIQECQQNLIEKNNEQENTKQKPHKYHVDDKVMIKNDQQLKYGTNTYNRPYQIIQVTTTGQFASILER
eukprot:2738970-Ditylum_brightwellii.AAC.1